MEIKRYPLRIPADFHAAIETEAKNEGRSLHSYIIEIMQEGRQYRAALKAQKQNPQQLIQLAKAAEQLPNKTP
jgi:hypothetical protein